MFVVFNNDDTIALHTIERCRNQGLKMNGTKGDLVDRLLNPDGPDSKRSYKRQKLSKSSSSGRAGGASSLSQQRVYALLRQAGYADPENRASKCAMRAIQRGHLTVDASGDDDDGSSAGENRDPASTGGRGLDKVVFCGECLICGGSAPATLRDLLDQPDYGRGHEGGGAARCSRSREDGGCGGNMRWYVTRLCEGKDKMMLVGGESHNHCVECKGFGKCIHDYRNAHCGDCNKHYFQGRYGYSCPCGENPWGV